MAVAAECFSIVIAGQKEGGGIGVEGQGQHRAAGQGQGQVGGTGVVQGEELGLGVGEEVWLDVKLRRQPKDTARAQIIDTVRGRQCRQAVQHGVACSLQRGQRHT